MISQTQAKDLAPVVWTVDDVFSLTWSKALPANAIYTNKPREIRP